MGTGPRCCRTMFFHELPNPPAQNGHNQKFNSFKTWKPKFTMRNGNSFWFPLYANVGFSNFKKEHPGSFKNIYIFFFCVQYLSLPMYTPEYDVIFMNKSRSNSKNIVMVQPLLHTHRAFGWAIDLAKIKEFGNIMLCTVESVKVNICIKQT